MSVSLFLQVNDPPLLRLSSSLCPSCQRLRISLWILDLRSEDLSRILDCQSDCQQTNIRKGAPGALEGLNGLKGAEGRRRGLSGHEGGVKGHTGG